MPAHDVSRRKAMRIAHPPVASAQVDTLSG
jgi:hypothetical protein